MGTHWGCGNALGSWERTGVLDDCCPAGNKPLTSPPLKFKGHCRIGTEERKYTRARRQRKGCKT